MSCSSQTACIAVGRSSPTAEFAERWNGIKWSLQPTPSLGGVQSSLNAVSCVAPTACTAVGSRDLRGLWSPLVERWNGKRWSIQPTPTPGSGGGLLGVSCSSTRSCTAVGARSECLSTPSCAGGDLIESWNGNRWSMEPSANPAVQTQYLTAVSCVSPTACAAVAATGGTSLLAERWNGTSWSTEPITTSLPEVRDSLPYLTGMSCASASARTATIAHFSCGECGFVPQATPTPIVARWDGATWSIRHLPTPLKAQPDSALNGVSCPTTTTCMAVGMYSPVGSIRPRTLVEVERWTGSK